MPVIDLGKVVGDPGASMRFRGEWNGGSEYFNNKSYIDTVTHHGSLWVCKQTNTGQEPIEGDYWGIGAQGNSDLNASDVTYDNESSGLSSNTAQGAIDEIVEIEKVVNGNQADLYSPDETYTAGRLVIKNNALWKAKQNIDVPEPWTESHWESTTLAAEFSLLNSSINSKATYIYLDDSSAVNDPIGVVKNRWSDIADGVYIADIMCGGRFCALVQRVNGGQYGAVYAIGYGIEQPAYGRCIGGSWS